MNSSIIEQLFTPPESADVCTWAERHIKEIPYSPRAFTLDSPPFFREVLAAVASAHTRRCVISACVQSGKTLAPEIALAYLITTDPAPAMWIDMTDQSAKDQSEGRLRRLFEAIPPVKEQFNDNPDKMRNATMIFRNGMTLWVCGQNNLRNLQRRSVCYVFGDETWQWEKGRMAEAAARTTAFPRGKCVFMSQGGLEGDDTDAAFRATDAREWNLRCPQCGKHFAPLWAHVRWDKATIGGAAVRVRLACPHCAAEFEDSERSRDALNAGGKFVATNPAAPRGNVGFHWNALATMSWTELVGQHLAAKAQANRGDISALRIFFQKRLALPWREREASNLNLYDAADALRAGAAEFKLGDAWAEEAAFDPRGAIFPAGTQAPEGAFPLRFLTIDVQADYFYFVVRSWSANGDSRLRTCGIAQTFEELADVAMRERVFPVLTFIDSGFRAPLVFDACARHNWTALKGSPLKEWVFAGGGNEKYKKPYSPRENISIAHGRTARRHQFSNLRMKDILHALRSGKTALKWELPCDAPDNYLKMLDSEIRNDEKEMWEQIARRPNHFFDCEVMQICGAAMLGVVG